MSNSKAKVEQKPKLACTHKKQTVLVGDLPLSCPNRDALLWNAHPKIYLPIEKEGEVTCPYCGTYYVLKHD